MIIIIFFFLIYFIEIFKTEFYINTYLAYTKTIFGKRV